jgi:cell wall-associated NlpC family hydrolase
MSSGSRHGFVPITGPALRWEPMARRFLLAASALAVTLARPSFGSPATPPERADSPVLEAIRRIDKRVRTTRYVHATRVDEGSGRYEFDCSGMAAWVLARGAPAAHATVMRHSGRGRPVASDYFDVMAQASDASARDGWLRVAHARDLRPGDMIAWRKPSAIASSNTGHVVFVVSAPQRVDEGGQRFLVRVADSTSIPHGDDTRPRRNASGFGYGTITLFLDHPDSDVVAYGWQGIATRIDFRTPLALGRPVR